MNFDLINEQTILKEGAHKFLAKNCSSDYVRKMVKDEKGFTEELWTKMADMDWMGIPIPEQYGGSGGTFLDIAVLLSEMGYQLTPGPFFSTVVLGGLTILEAGTKTQKEKNLPTLCSGKRFFTLAWVEEEGAFLPEGIRVSAKMSNGQYVLSGTKVFVPDAHVADIIICAARMEDSPENPADGISLLLVDASSPGIDIQPLKTIAGDKQFVVHFDNVTIPPENLLGNPGEGWQTLHRVLLMAAVAKCAEVSGGAERVMELVVSHVNERVQFGRPVGSFQAVQHHCSDMLTYLDTIKYMVYYAAWKISAGLDYEKEASMCKAWASEAYRKYVALAHQVTGGMGFMEEFDLHLYFRQAELAAFMFGSADFHRELIAIKMGM